MFFPILIGTVAGSVVGIGLDQLGVFPFGLTALIAFLTSAAVTAASL